MTNNSNHIKEDEIDIVALLKVFSDNKNTIIKYTVFGCIVGLLVAFLTPNTYTASTIMVPQTSNNQPSKLGGLSSIAAMAGLNLGNSSSSETLSPVIYPRILNSLTFQTELLNAMFNYTSCTEKISLANYYNDYKRSTGTQILAKYTVGLPGLIIKSIKGDNSPTLSTNKQDGLLTTTIAIDKARESLSEDLSIELNENEGFITIRGTFQDPNLAASVTQKALNLLQNYITEYKIEKASQQLSYVTERFKEQKIEFDIIQKELAQFRDRNKNMSTAVALTQEQVLQSQYNIAYSVYSELAKQLEQAKLKVKEDTPILTVIDPVKIPNKKTGPKRLIIVFVASVFGAFLGIGITFFLLIVSALKRQWTTNL